MDAETEVQSLEDLSPEALLQEKAWPVPTWYRPDSPAMALIRKRAGSYETYLTRRLQVRYVTVESDFRSVYGNFHGPDADHVTAQRAANLLHLARKSLESPTPDLLTVASTLNLVEWGLVWLYPPDVLRIRAAHVALRLKAMATDGPDGDLARLGSAIEAGINAEDDANVRCLLDEGIVVLNEHVLDEQIGSALQFARLATLFRRGLVLLMIVLAAAPLAMDRASASAWPSSWLTAWLEAVFVPPVPSLVAAWMTAIPIAVFGAAGGFLSALLQARASKVGIADYLISMLGLQLKPLVGALIALLLSAFLSWNVLVGVTIQNPGSFLLIAFLAGFSERFFLRLLNLKPDDDTAGPRRPLRAAGVEENPGQPTVDGGSPKGRVASA